MLRGGRRFLVVTGMPRSGTTGVGSALALAPHAASYYEPLNPLSGLTTVSDYFCFPQPGEDQHDVTGPELRAQIDRVLGLDLRLRAGIWPSDPGWRRMVKTVTGSRTRVSALRCRLDPRVRTVVWKDPFASFLVPVLQQHYGLPCVVTVRSPEACAASFKRLGWGFDLDRVHRHLSRLTPEAGFLAHEPSWRRWTGSPATNGALLWRLLYGFLDHALPPATAGDPSPSGSSTPVLWANSRSLLASPVATYEALYAALGLPFDAEQRAGIERTYRDQGAPEPASSKTHDRSRNVAQANDYWSRVLTDTERAEVAAIAEPVRARLEARVGPLSRLRKD